MCSFTHKESGPFQVNANWVYIRFKPRQKMTDTLLMEVVYKNMDGLFDPTLTSIIIIFHNVDLSEVNETQSTSEYEEW